MKNGIHTKEGNGLLSFKTPNSLITTTRTKNVYLELLSITLYEHQCWRPDNKVRSGMEKLQMHIKYKIHS